ncbi:MAG: (2Fe-2S) ferredoxin domain-containing protein, partial [Deltaproteobacteria bacterium]|nr:(2Fe-2S) ferredoxin domain-containing protein [Deltaproteobacteria bacterium]
MTVLLNLIDDERCTHTLDTPCHRFVDCIQGGPQCFDNPEVSAKLSRWKGQRLRLSPEKPAIFIGTGTCGLGAGAGATLKAIEHYIADRTLDIEVVQVGCVGACAAEPVVDIQLPGKTRLSFGEVTADKVTDLLDNVLAGDLPKASSAMFQWRAADFDSWSNVVYMDEESFFAGQKRWVLANCGVINPVD